MNRRNRAFSLIELSIVILIIAIIVSGVVAASSVYSKSKLLSARTITNSSPVSGIKDLVLWIDSTSEASFDNTEQENNSYITAWYDLNPQNGLKNNFTQSDEGTNPIYQKNSLNGLPSIYFDGVSSYISTANAINGDDVFKNNDFTVFMVAKFPQTITETAVIFQFSSDGGDRLLGLEFNNDPAQLRIDSSNTTVIAAESDFDFQKPIVISGSRDSSNTTFYSNGLQVASETSGENQTISGKFYLGSYRGAEYFTQGNIGEVIVYGRALKPEERKSVEKYLGQKWGVKISS